MGNDRDVHISWEGAGKDSDNGRLKRDSVSSDSDSDGRDDNSFIVDDGKKVALLTLLGQICWSICGEWGEGGAFVVYKSYKCWCAGLWFIKYGEHFQDNRLIEQQQPKSRHV